IGQRKLDYKLDEWSGVTLSDAHLFRIEDTGGYPVRFVNLYGREDLLYHADCSDCLANAIVNGSPHIIVPETSSIHSSSHFRLLFGLSRTSPNSKRIRTRVRNSLNLLDFQAKFGLDVSFNVHTAPHRYRSDSPIVF